MQHCNMGDLHFVFCVGINTWFEFNEREIKREKERERERVRVSDSRWVLTETGGPTAACVSPP